MSKAKTEDAVAVAEEVITHAKAPADDVVELDEPIRRGSSEITEVQIRKPKSGELRGVSLIELIQMDVLSLRKVLPRITIPTLTDIEIGNMDPADLLQCGVIVSGFLTPKSAKVDESHDM